MPPPRIRLNDSLWIRCHEDLNFYALKILQEALKRRGAEILWYHQPPQSDEIGALRKAISGTDKHIILDNLQPRMQPFLQDLLTERGNYSVGTTDWWTTPFELLESADWIFFRHYSGIEARRTAAPLSLDPPVPFWSAPEWPSSHQAACAAARLAHFAAMPFLALRNRRRRQRDRFASQRCLYFPYAVRPMPEAAVAAAPEWDFSNVGATSFFCRARDPYAPVSMSFINLYSDRKALADGLLAHENRPFRIFDSRRTPVRGAETSAVIARSKFAISTGGIHRASVLKFLEIPCLGTPMIGRLPPREFPVVGNCVFPVRNGLHGAELNRALRQALDEYPRYRDNAGRARVEILKLYDQDRLLDLLQDQLDGKPVPAEYLAP